MGDTPEQRRNGRAPLEVTWQDSTPGQIRRVTRTEAAEIVADCRALAEEDMNVAR